MTKAWLRFYSYERNTGKLRMIIGGIEYVWDYVSGQFIEEIQRDIFKGYNQHRILARLEKYYKKGKKTMEGRRGKNGL